jgi:hypothetical protein
MSGHIAGTPDAPVRSAAILTLRGRMGRQVVDELVSGGHGQHQDSAGERQRRRKGKPNKPAHNADAKRQ